MPENRQQVSLDRVLRVGILELESRNSFWAETPNLYEQSNSIPISIWNQEVTIKFICDTKPTCLLSISDDFNFLKLING